jgi:predicted peptidase
LRCEDTDLEEPMIRIPRPVRRSAIALAAAILACGARFEGDPMSRVEFLEREVEVGGTAHRYRVYVPRARPEEGERRPIILFLHGAGERGSDNARQTRVGLGPAIRRHPERFPAVVVFPQCRDRAYWRDDMEEMALTALAASEKEFDSDPKRVYLTGLSLGGYAAWSIAAKTPDRFAAIVPVCGGIRAPWDREPPEGDPYVEAARRVKHLPIWIFHGAADRTVPAEESRKMAAALKELRADSRYTEYEGVGHNCWDRAYLEPKLMEWLLSHSRK